MGLVVHQDKITPEIALELTDLCPFGAIEWVNNQLVINAACKSCKICVKKGPAGAMTWTEENKAEIDKSQWQGVAVFAEQSGEGIHPVTLELLGKARELVQVTGQKVYAICIGFGLQEEAEKLLHYGADQVYLYDDPLFEHFLISPFTAAFYDFIQQVKPSAVLVGATHLGRSLAPRIAARCHAGLTADCTVLGMKENTDLIQIRPAFGGNIMAQIITPHTRPQFATVRYKVFSALPFQENPVGTVKIMPVTDAMKDTASLVLAVEDKPKEVDISEAEIIVACGRGFQKQGDLAMAQELADLLGGRLAGTRPIIENGWLGPKRQIGLSGRTVKPKLILALGVSGSVQFAAGMKNSDYIIALNQDPHANIFDIAHLGIVGDLYTILPELIDQIKEAKNV